MVDVGLFGVTVVEPLVEPEPVVVPPVVDVLPVVVVVLVEEVLVLVLVLVAVSAAVAGMDEVDPESPPPQPASAIVTLLSNAGQATRPARLTFFMLPRKNNFVVRPGRRSHLFRGVHERCSNAQSCWLISRGSRSAPATPLS